MRYQDVAGALILAADRVGLRTYYTQDQLDVEAMNRAFRVLCVPDNWDSPHDIRARLEFHWPCEQTAYSLYGTEGLCALYHDPEEPCTHYAFDPEPMIELEVEYHLPDQAVAALDSTTTMKDFGQRVRDAQRECVDHENLVAVRFESVFYQDRLRVSSAVASHHWVIEGEHLEDEENLAAILVGICNEVHDFLLHLADLFAQPERKSRKKGRRGRSRAG